MRVVIYEENEHTFYPLITLYPQFNLRIGMRTIAENTAYYFPKAQWNYVGRDIFRLKKLKPEVPTFYISGRVILTEKIVLPKDDVKFVINRKIVGFVKQRPPFPTVNKDIHHIARTIKKTKRISGFVLNNIWDLIKYNEPIVHHHFSMKESRGKMLKGIAIIGNKRDIYVAADARIHKQVTLDATDGPVYIDSGAVIRPFTTIIGPSYIGSGTIVERAKVTKSSIGPLCRIGGEVEASIFQDTKTGIGTLIPTGAVIGSFVNFFGGGTMPSFVRSFQWLTTERQEDYDLEKAITTAKIVMKRRDIRMSRTYEGLIRASYRWRNVS